MVLVLYQLAGLTAELPSIHGICQRFPPCIYFDTKDMLAKDFFFHWLSTCSATSKSLSLQRCQVADAAFHRASGQSSLGGVKGSKQTLHQAQHNDVSKNAPWKWDNTHPAEQAQPSALGLMEKLGCGMQKGFTRLTAKKGNLS